MDKIAIISDIHGNITALQAVLEDIKSRNINHIFCLGDLATKGPNPDKTIDLIKENCEVVIKGNCDDLLCYNYESKSLNWTINKIGEDRVNYLRTLPTVYDFYLSGQLVRLYHSSPYSFEHIFNPFYSNTNTKYLNYEIKNISDMFENTEFLGKSKDENQPDIVGFGHIHTPFLLKYKNKTLFNTGSVGEPTEMENDGTYDYTNSFTTMASYTILEGNLNSKELGSIGITNIRILYDIEKEIKYINESDLPYKESIIFNLKTGSINYKKEN